MYYIDNRGEVRDNLPNQVKTWNDPVDSATQDQNLNSARFVPVETVGSSPIARRTEEQ
jgi:hypothetical protein